MRWRYTLTVLGACTALAGGLVVVVSIATDPTMPIAGPAPTATTPPPPPRHTDIDPAELFGTDPGRMILYDTEQIPRDPMPDFEELRRRLGPPAMPPFDRS